MENPFIYKYQPIYLDDFEMDTELLRLIKSLIEMNTLNILFNGDPGSGKTDFIMAVIKEYYLSSGTATVINENVLTINSLKEQGIAYYRNDVKTFCQTASMIPGRKKFLILDDLDTINEQSQQVFRNCIDKYSHNVHFIGSCSNTQKVIDSLQSRMSIIKLRVVPLEKMRKIVKRICTQENIVIRVDAENFILSICNNSVRTLINYLEKFKLLKMEITLELATDVCTNISFQDFNRFTTYCKVQKDLRLATGVMCNLFDRGYSVMDILDNYFLFVKVTPLLTENEKYQIIPLLCKYITIFHDIHEDEIELSLFTNNLVTLFATQDL
jgi:DNA polymerase III delta prime subunit